MITGQIVFVAAVSLLDRSLAKVLIALIQAGLFFSLVWINILHAISNMHTAFTQVNKPAS